MAKCHEAFYFPLPFFLFVSFFSVISFPFLEKRKKRKEKEKKGGEEREREREKRKGRRGNHYATLHY